jgi:hypothetical protein
MPPCSGAEADPAAGFRSSPTASTCSTSNVDPAPGTDKAARLLPGRGFARTVETMERLVAPARTGLLVALALAPVGCGRRTPAVPPGRLVRLEVEVRADTGRGGSFTAPPEARAWLAGVSRERPPQIAPARLAPPRPEPPRPEPGPLPSEDQSAPGLAIDPALKPPILRGPGVLTVPAGHAVGSVDLDVLVNERGEVEEALPARAGADTTLVAAARRCALGMRFYPALRAGRPVAVWCRQRFDVGAAR